eukprot:TRINITY_DN28496_c0_g1_i1.p1 TRINITY_DN28496_c0_g1~~TRINITY_DN28496_c0_g1_i1.p1  ORF type:complete len:374 (+),score=93.64 TRINITY_DN28496_c0_g1_i1:103-1224(+)
MTAGSRVAEKRKQEGAESESQNGAEGSSSKSQRLASKLRYFAGVDLGGTTVAVGILDQHGSLLAASSPNSSTATGVQVEPLGDDHNPGVVVGKMKRLLEACLKQAALAVEDLDGVGVCTPGLLDYDHGIVRVAANLKDWRDVKLVDLLAKELGIGAQKVVLEHDTNAALLAEAWTGAAAGVRNVVLMTLGTGVGGAILCDGHLLRGSKGQAGEMGHAILVPDGRRHGGAGVNGILEGYASASAVVMRAVEEGIPESSSLSTVDKESLQCKDVFRHAEKGDKFAAEIVSETARYLAIGCINCCRFVDPEVILFSGGMAEAGEFLLKEVRRHFAAYHWNIEPVSVGLRLAATGRHAGLLGAARAAALRSDASVLS